MADRTGPRTGARVAWLAALVGIPAVLAGVSLLWVVTSGTAVPDGTRPGTVEPGTAPVPTGPALAETATAQATGDGATAGTAAPTAASPSTPPDDLAARREALVTGIAVIVADTPVVFAADSAVLEGPAASAVARVAGALRAEPEFAVELVGHSADTPGPPETAQDLSERRAAAVADALVVAGVDRSRITAVGRGATRPLGTLAASRRVEISVP